MEALWNPRALHMIFVRLPTRLTIGMEGLVEIRRAQGALDRPWPPSVSGPFSPSTS